MKFVRIGTLLVTAFLGLAASARAESGAPDLATARVVDLTHAFDRETIYWPTSPSAFELKSLADGRTPGGWFYRSNAFCTPEHGGTHLDAPSHFAEKGRTADEIPVRQLIARAAVIDVRARGGRGRRLPFDSRRREGLGESPRGDPGGDHRSPADRMERTWPNRKAYLGDDTPSDASKLHFPSYGKASAEYLVHERKVGALGVDTASIDAGASKDFIVHVLANGANVPGLENLARLEELPESGAWVIALPMKIAGGSGGPLRIVALLP